MLLKIQDLVEALSLTPKVATIFDDYINNLLTQNCNASFNIFELMSAERNFEQLLDIAISRVGEGFIPEFNLRRLLSTRSHKWGNAYRDGFCFTQEINKYSKTFFIRDPFNSCSSYNDLINAAFNESLFHIPFFHKFSDKPLVIERGYSVKALHIDRYQGGILHERLSTELLGKEVS